MNTCSFTFTGNEKVVIKELFHTIYNSFTYELWVKPEVTHQIDQESTKGVSGLQGKRYVIAPGHARDTKKSGIGISVGTNGVSVYEHSNDYLPAVLVHPMEILDWVHIALVYKERTPYLYVNGELVKTGLTSLKEIVWASGVFGAHDPYGSFVGEIGEIRLWNGVRTREQIRNQMNVSLMGSEPDLYGYWIFEQDGVIVKDHTPKQNHGELGWVHYLRAVLNEENYQKFQEIENKPAVTIIIPLLHSLERIQTCIHSVLQNSDHPYYLYLVQDRPSGPDIRQFLRELKNSRMPTHLRKLTVIRNRNNGLSLSKNHIILLDTDCEVPKNWISRLMNPIWQDDTIASVSPFTKENISEWIPHKMSLSDVDHLFEKYGTNLPIRNSAEIGSCMAINRRALKQLGMFEEGDERGWCLKAEKAGFQHVWITNLFVSHQNSVLFTQEDQNLKIPDLLQKVDDLLSSLVTTHIQREKQGILFVCNRIGGGTEYYQNKYIQEVQYNARVYKLMLASDMIFVQELNQDSNRFFTLRLEDLNQKMFNQILKVFAIDLIYVNHFIQFPVFQLMNLIQYSKVDYVYFIHDYFSACPRHHLVNQYGVYCGGETNLDICRSCLGNPSEDIKTWRDQFSSFLAQAKRIIAPSQNAKEMIRKFYPNTSIEVKEHTLSNKIYPTFNPDFAYGEVLNIAFVGYLHGYKGMNILYDVLSKVRKEMLPIRIKVIGFTNLHFFPFESRDHSFLVTGKYDNEEISHLLAKHKVAAVVIPSICPETYSFTTSEAMLSGYPVITFNLGAPAERVRRTGGGWVIDTIEGEKVVELLTRLVNNRDEIVQKASCLSP